MDANDRVVWVVRREWSATFPLAEPAFTGARNEWEAANDALAPCDPEWIAGRIGTLMNHFYVADIPSIMIEKMLIDWMDALESYPQWAIDAAVRDYLREEERRPTIAAIVGRCIGETSKISAQLDALKKIIDLGPAIEERAQ